MTKAEQLFIDQYTRKLLVDWAHHQAVAPEDPSVFEDRIALERCGHQCALGYQPYIDYAKHKGWVSKDGKRVLAKGFSVATSALKRGT